MLELVRTGGGREVLVVGDAAYTLRSIREQVLPLFTVDDKRYRRSLRKIAELEPQVILTGHGQPVTQDATRALKAIL